MVCDMRKLFILLALLLAPFAASAQCTTVGPAQVQNNLSDLCSASTSRTSLGLGSIATQAASAVAITGGTATGFTSLGMSSTGAFYGASGTTAQQPTATAGGLRFNSQTGSVEFANGSSWTALGTGAGSVTSVATGAGLSGGTITSTGTIVATTNTLTTDIPFFIDGGGSAITTSTCSYSSGQLCVVEVPYACTITAVRMFADQTGSAVIEVAKTTYSSYAPGTHPVSGDKITASAPPTISSASKSEDTTLTGWTTSVAAGSVLGFSVTSASTVTRIAGSITCVKT